MKTFKIEYERNYTNLFYNKKHKNDYHFYSNGYTFGDIYSYTNKYIDNRFYAKEKYLLLNIMPTVIIRHKEHFNL